MKNLFLITVKTSNTTNKFYIDADDMLSSIVRANEYMNQTRTPGVAYEIIEVSFVGQIAVPEYDCTDGGLDIAP